MTTLTRSGAAGLGTNRKLQIAIGLLCLIGIGIAGYLTYVHYAGLKVLCLSSGGCETVQASRYAKLDGIPVAVLGLAGYIGILGSLALRGELGRMAGFGIALIGFGFSMYLTYRELFTIKAICQWCVASAVLMTLLAILTAVRVLRADDDGGAAALAQSNGAMTANGGRRGASDGSSARRGRSPAQTSRKR
ncbi:MAG: vitamin K epoxide reductase family protein [Solirubrobacterales bacterium]|nr:vitamin K epoxide reductase family protein [Solirubrobacterales bacterium]